MVSRELIAASTRSPSIAQTVPSAAEIVTAAQRSSLHRNTVAAAGIGRLGLSQVEGEIVRPAGATDALEIRCRAKTTGRTGVKAHPISVPVYTEEEATGLPPFFMDRPADRWLP